MNRDGPFVKGLKRREILPYKDLIWSVVSPSCFGDSKWNKSEGLRDGALRTIRSTATRKCRRETRVPAFHQCCSIPEISGPAGEPCKIRVTPGKCMPEDSPNLIRAEWKERKTIRVVTRSRSFPDSSLTSSSREFLLLSKSHFLENLGLTPHLFLLGFTTTVNSSTFNKLPTACYYCIAADYRNIASGRLKLTCQEKILFPLSHWLPSDSSIAK